MSEIIVPNKIPVALHPSPLRLDVRSHVAQEGQTILDILLDISDLPPEVWTHGVVFLGEWEVPRNLWDKVKPKGNSKYILRVCIRYGGGGGKNILGTILAIALVIAVTAISGGALAGFAGTTLFAAGSTSAALAAAGVAIVGSLAINALSPTPSLETGTTEQDNSVSGLGSASVRGNVLGAAQVIPFVAGKHRVSPPHVILPFSEAVNDDQFIYTIIALNGAHLYEDIRINGAPIEDFVDVEYEVRDVVSDDTNITLITQQVFENQVGAEVSGHKIKDDATDELQNEIDPDLSYPQWQSARSRRDPDEVWLTFGWSTLIKGDDAGGTAPGGMAVRIRIRRVGSSTWINLPEFHAQRERPQAFRGIIKLVFQVTPSNITRPDQAPSFPPWESALFITDTQNDETFDVDDYFDDGSTLFAQNVGQIDGTILVYLDPDMFPKGIYDIQVKRGYAYEASLLVPSTYLYDTDIPYFFSHIPASDPPAIREEQSKIPAGMTWASASSVWDEYPLGEKGMSLLVLKAKNISISQLSVLATGYANVWNGSDWNTFEPTQNPAAWYRHLALGGQSVDTRIVESQLDDDSFEEWFEYCGSRTLALISDGSQYFTRDAGLTGASDGTQITLNLWLYLEAGAEGTIFSGVTTLGGTTTRFLVDITSAGICQITARNSAGTVILDVETSALIQESWNNILLSVDLSDSADRHLYVNDSSDLTVTTYTNDDIDLTLADWSVFALADGSDGVVGGIAELWFDDSYIDLSVESNRRLFIDEYGRPVNLSSLSSLIYLRESANIGTGGDFTENGTFLQEKRKISGGEPILECNAFFSSERSLVNVLRVIAATGNASQRISDKIGVVIDNDRSEESPIESFTQRNSSGLTIRRAFPRIPDGLRVAFNDENNDYLPNEVFIFRKFPANIIEAIDYTGITDEASARDRAARDFRQLLLRNALYQVGTDIQHLYCTKGSLVTLAHDTLRRHTDSARILKADTSGGDITDIHVDAALRLDLVGDAVGALFSQDLLTKLLLHFDGSDVSTTFIDSSLFVKTFTASGNAQLDTAEFRFGTASGLFDGTGDWIDASDSADFTLDDQDFAIEGWFFIDTVIGTDRDIAGQGDSAGNNSGRAWLLQRNADGRIHATVWQGTTDFTIVSRDIYDNDENNPGWHHVAFTRESDILRLFIDGVQQGSLPFTGSVNDSADELGIGVFGGDSSVNPWLGWIDEFRLTIGEARYVDDFDVQGNAFPDPEAAYLTRGAGLTGAADSGTVAFSFWINPEEYPTADQHIVSLEESGNVRFAIVLRTTGAIQLFARNAAGTTILDVDTATLLLPNQWFHVCGSVDLSDTADRHVFIDDVSSDLTVTTYTDDDIDFTTNSASVGGRPDGSQLFGGSLAEVWLEDGLFIDFSVEANRRDFISTNERPVSLGSDGSGPGVSPLVYLSGQNGDFPTNKGTGGGFTENGSLTPRSIFYSDAGFPAGVVIQLQDGTTLTAQVDEEDETSVLTFSTPQPLPSYMSDEGSWAGSTSYAQEDVVVNGGESYTCIVDHTSSSSSEPGVGTDWIDFWEPLLRDCLVASGPFSSVNKRMLVLGIKVNPDLSANLTLIDEGPRPYVTAQLGTDDIYAPDGSRIRAPY